MITCPTCRSPNDPGRSSCLACGAPLGSGAELDALPLGTLVASRYRIEKLLGRGGFGITYLATHTNLGYRVALKEYFPAEARRVGRQVTFSSGGGQARDEFPREGRILGGLQHPGIVRVADIFEEANTVYLVMDFVEGTTLGELVEQGGRLGEEEALGYIRQATEALRVVHQANLLHQDIKPDNLMLRPRQCR